MCNRGGFSRESALEKCDLKYTILGENLKRVEFQRIDSFWSLRSTSFSETIYV